MFNALRNVLTRWFGPSAPEDTSASSQAADEHMVLHAEADDEQNNTLVPYDENLLERARTQWQFGDWESLAALERDQLQHHPDRGKLALLAAAGLLQTGDSNEARNYIRLAQDWGVSKTLISQILVAGVHNSIGRAAAVSNNQHRALQHFENAIAIGTPGADAKLLTQARARKQLDQLGVTATQDYVELKEREPVIAARKVRPLSQDVDALADALKQQKAELDSNLKKQADDLIKVRKFLDSSLKKEVSNATKQMEAFAGLQSYFATGELPSVNTERHSWPISPDFSLYLIELIEFNDYDLIIEFGSGISTVIVAKALAKMAPKRSGKPPVEFVSFDHLEHYYQQTLTQLQHAGLEHTVQLTLAPLKDWAAPNGNTYSYYDCQPTLAALETKHPAAGKRLLAIIDGPPGSTGKHARYPAGPLILQHFKGAQIDLLLDDYIRDDEKEIAQLWQDDFTAAKLAHTSTVRRLEKDACLIAVRNYKEST